MGFRFNSAKSSQKEKKNKKRPAPPPKKATAHKSIAQSGTIKPSRSCEGGHVHFFFSTTEGNTTPGRKKSKAVKQLTVWGFCMFHQVSARCLRRQSSVSTAGFFLFFWMPVCAVFFFRPVLSWWGGADGGEICKLEMGFLFFLFGAKKKKKKKRMKGSCPWWWNRGIRGRLQHVLSLQRMAGGAQSTRGASVHTFLHVHLCVSRAWWWGCVWGERFFHSVVTSHFYIICIHPLWLTCLREVRGWGEARCAAGFKVDLGGRFFFTGEYGGVRLIMMRDWSHRATPRCF